MNEPKDPVNEPKDPAMEEIWAIKEQCWREVEHLPLDEAIRESLRRANATAVRLGFAHLIVPSPRHARMKESGGK